MIHIESIKPTIQKNTASGHLNTEAVFHLLLLLINDISFIKKDPSKRDKHDKVDNKHGY